MYKKVITDSRNKAVRGNLMKVTEFEQGMSAACSEMSEEQILHSASSIIRRDIESLDIEHEFYPCFSRNIFGENAIASAIVRLELNTILDIP
jgi:hypothetical protein